MAPPNLPEATTLRQEWGGYIQSLPLVIGKPYEYVGHLTYQDHADIPRHHQAAIVERRFNYFVRQINERLYGKRWMRQGKGVFGAMAIEKIPDFPHHHFIIGGEGLRVGMRRLDLMDMWERDLGHGIARVTDYRGEAAARYLVKYITKGSIVDIFTAPGTRHKLQS